MPDTAVLSKSSIDRLQRRLRDIAPISARGRKNYAPGQPKILIVIDGHAVLGSTGGRYKYAWHMLKLSGDDFDTVGDAANGFSGTTDGDDWIIALDEINATASGPAWDDGTIAELEFYLDADNVIIGVFTAIDTGNIIDVVLTKDGGTDGNKTTAPSYTYTPTDLDGNPVKDGDGTTLTHMEPNHNQPNGKTMVATQGQILIMPDGQYVLRWTDECPNFNGCSDS